MSFLPPQQHPNDDEELEPLRPLSPAMAASVAALKGASDDSSGSNGWSRKRSIGVAGLVGFILGSYVALTVSEMRIGGLRAMNSGRQPIVKLPAVPPYEAQGIEVQPTDMLPPSTRYRPCNNSFEAEHQEATYCTLTACDDDGHRVRIQKGQSGKAGTGLPYSEGFSARCKPNIIIKRDVPPLSQEERTKNDENRDRFSFMWYPGRPEQPSTLPDCQAWFFDRQPNHMQNTVSKYLTWKIPTTGISTGVYYNQHIKVTSTTRNPKILYLYTAHTGDQYYRDTSLFNLRAVRQAFGDDVFIIFTEIYQEVNIEAFSDHVDVFLHANFSSPDM